jgi:Kdo2-lipid IVA lauroyltransferase/acyltransferase
VTRLILGFMYLVHAMPLPWIARIGDAVGVAMFWLIPERRRVTRINLEKCFPQMPARERERLARAHFRAFCRSFIERGILWWSPRERIERLVRLEGLEHLQSLEGRPVILFTPHFVGLDATLAKLGTLGFTLAGMYAQQKDALFDRVLFAGRARFGVRLHPRQAGLRAVLKSVARGERYYYLPDLDYGPRGSVFVPFFGVPAATTVALSYIARRTGAAVVPCVTRMLPGGGYVGRLYPAWTDFPGTDEAADARRMLSFIEERVMEMPEQYHWLHKRFKTRPAGEQRFY